MKTVREMLASIRMASTQVYPGKWTVFSNWCQGWGITAGNKFFFSKIFLFCKYKPVILSGGTLTDFPYIIIRVMSFSFNFLCFMI